MDNSLFYNYYILKTYAYYLYNPIFIHIKSNIMSIVKIYLKQMQTQLLMNQIIIYIINYKI